MIRKYSADDHAESSVLIYQNAPIQGYAFHDLTQIDELIFDHPYFSSDHTFVNEEDDNIVSIVCGCTGDDIPHGDERGYFSFLVSDREHDTEENARQMFGMLEDSFKEAGKRYSAVTFFNPMRLPWIMPGTPGFEHNNMPGIAMDTSLFEWMKDLGYTYPAVECAMFCDLAQFQITRDIEDLEKNVAIDGYSYGRYDRRIRQGLGEMLDKLGNPDWITRINKAGAEDMLLPVMLHGNTVVGFAGPVYPEPTGRGYFAGIGIDPDHQHHGLGKVLFYHLCNEEKNAGAKYMSLFTGDSNPARNIYRAAGFREVRRFGVMIKEL